MRILAHISDLHFGTVIPEIAEGLWKKLEELSPDIVVVSGDITQRARSSQFKAAGKYLAHIPFPLLIVPGNHDIPLYNIGARFFSPLTNYKKYITADLYPFFRDEKIAVQGISTARSLAHAGGRISDIQMEKVYQKMIRLPDSLIKILVTHHPFLAPPHQPGKKTVGRAARALQVLEACKPDILLAGHFHMSYSDQSHAAYTWPNRSVLVVQAGTALSSRTRNYEKNAFNLLRITKNRIHILVYAWKDREFSEENEKQYMLKDKGWEPV